MHTVPFSDLLSSAAAPGSLLYRHPEYEHRRWWWQFFRISYLGGREYLQPSSLSVEFVSPTVGDGTTIVEDTTSTYRSMLYRHTREKSFEFANRHRRAHYHNFVKTIVNMLVAHALKRPPTREGGALQKQFWTGVDREARRSMDQFMRHGLRWAAVEGIMWACVDATSGASPRPYAYWVNPLDVFDWQMGQDGAIDWLKQFVYVEGRREWNQGVDPRYRFRIWTRTSVTTYETDSRGSGQTKIEERAHGLGMVPFVPLYSLREEDTTFPDGTSLVADLCKTANHVFNVGSLLSEILYKQTFSWLAVPDKDVDTLQMGLNTAFGYDPGKTSAVPTYVSPDADQARVLMEAIGSAMEQARQSVGIGRGRSESSKSQASAEALELESEDKRSILGDIVDEAEDFERRLIDVANRYRRTQPEKAEVRYSREFDVRSLNSEITDVLSMRNLRLSPEVTGEMARQLVRRWFAGMDERRLGVLLDTLDSAQDPGMVNGQPQVKAEKHENGDGTGYQEG